MKHVQFLYKLKSLYLNRIGHYLGRGTFFKTVGNNIVIDWTGSSLPHTLLKTDEQRQKCAKGCSSILPGHVSLDAHRIF